MWSSDPNCTIPSSGYELTRNTAGDPQNYRAGEGVIDLAHTWNPELETIEGRLQVNLATAKPGLWVVWLKGSTPGDVEGFIELRFTFTSLFGDLNDPPYFVSLLPTDKPLED